MEGQNGHDLKLDAIGSNGYIDENVGMFKPKGISISSAMPSIPMNVKATTVTTGMVAHPKS